MAAHTRKRPPRHLLGLGLVSLVLLSASSAAALVQEGDDDLPVPAYGYGAAMTTSGTRFSLIAPSFLAFGDALVDAGAPVTQTVLNSSGQSEAFASLPYPGELAVTAGDLVGGATGVASPLPPYPLFIKSTYPNQPENTLSVGAGELTAATSPRRAHASGRFAASPLPSLLDIGSLSGTADSEINDRGEVEVSGVTVMRGVDIGGLLKIGELRSELHGVLDAAGKPTWTSHLELTGASIAGVALTVTPAGLRAADATFPSLLGSADSLLALLSTAGIDVELVKAAPAVGDATSMTSEALRVIFRQPGTRGLANGLVPIAPPTQVQFLLGSSTGRLSPGGEAPGSFIPDQAPLTDAPLGENLDFGSDPGALSSGLVPALGGVPRNPAGSASTGGETGRPQLAFTARDLQAEVLMPYLILAFGGFAIVTFVTSWRRWIAPMATRSMRP